MQGCPCEGAESHRGSERCWKKSTAVIPALADRETKARHAARSCSQPSKRQTKATGAPLLLPLQPQPPPAPKLLWRSKIASATPRMEPDSPPAPAALRRPLSLRGSPARWHLCHSGAGTGGRDWGWKRAVSPPRQRWRGDGEANSGCATCSPKGAQPRCPCPAGEEQV